MNKNYIRQIFFPLLAAMIWGTAFVAQRNGSQYIEPFTFNAVRSAIASIFLGILILIIILFKKKKNTNFNYKSILNKTSLSGGIWCGIALFTASYLQQYGISITSAGKAGFITALYIILVPIFGLFIHKKAPLTVWIGVCISIFGLYLLCVKENMTITSGDLLILLCSVVFAFHILIIDHYTEKVNGMVLSCIQFIVVAVLSAIFMFIFESPNFKDIIKCSFPLIYTGVFSSGIAYTLQILAQKNSNPTVVCVLLSLESVFATLAGMIILNEKMMYREYIGCLLMFIAVILVQLDLTKKDI